MSRRVAKQHHRISMSYAGFHQTAATPRDMKRDMRHIAGELCRGRALRIIRVRECDRWQCERQLRGRA
jgi:hypothetical protein